MKGIIAGVALLLAMTIAPRAQIVIHPPGVELGEHHRYHEYHPYRYHEYHPYRHEDHNSDHWRWGHRWHHHDDDRGED